MVESDTFILHISTVFNLDQYIYNSQFQSIVCCPSLILIIVKVLVRPYAAARRTTIWQSTFLTTVSWMSSLLLLLTIFSQCHHVVTLGNTVLFFMVQQNLRNIPVVVAHISIKWTPWLAFWAKLHQYSGLQLVLCKGDRESVYLEVGPQSSTKRRLSRPGTVGGR